MATINYGTRLQNVRNRKFDGSLNESLIFKSFSRTDIPENIKYLLEITKPLGDDYNTKTKLAAERVQNHLERGFNYYSQDPELPAVSPYQFFCCSVYHDVQVVQIWYITTRSVPIIPYYCSLLYILDLIIGLGGQHESDYTGSCSR